MWNLYIHNADFLARGLVIVKAAKILARDQRVAFAVLLTFRFEDRTKSGATLLQVGRNYLEMEFLLFAAILKLNRKLRGLDTATLEDAEQKRLGRVLRRTRKRIELALAAI